MSLWDKIDKSYLICGWTHSPEQNKQNEPPGFHGCISEYVQWIQVTFCSLSSSFPPENEIEKVMMESVFLTVTLWL